MKFCVQLVALATVFLQISCGGSDGGGNSGDGSCNEAEALCSAKATPFVNWENIPSKFNPKMEERQISIDGLQKIELNLFGFDKDVDLIYSDKLKSHEGVVQMYTVRSEDAETSLTGVDVRKTARQMRLSKTGSYQCALKVENGQINKLSGACYVRVAVYLPVKSEIEIYNVGRLVSPRFFAMSTESFLESMGSSSLSKDDKLFLVDEYLDSHKAIQKDPELYSAELGQALEAFAFADNKFVVLKKLHPFVTDRNQLQSMIEDQFSIFDQEEALSIVGL